MRALIRMGALIGIGALINKNTFEGGAYSEGGAYWKEGAKSNHYGNRYSYVYLTTKNIPRIQKLCYARYEKPLKHQPPFRCGQKICGNVFLI